MIGSVTNGWVEVADRCFLRRYASFDVNVGVVGGAAGLLVVDSRASGAEGRALRDDLRVLSADPVAAVVNTHWHFDHTFGNEAFAGVPIHAHDSVPARLADWGPGVRSEWAERDDVRAAEIAATTLVPPDRLLSSVGLVDLGDRLVELLFPGRGHTDGDLVIRVPDADAVFAGDLVEESGPPSYGEDSFPLEWPGTLDMVIGVLTEQSAVIVGHGAVVDKEYVEDQRQLVTDVANTVHAMATSRTGVEAALKSPEWPALPTGMIRAALARGYAALGVDT